MKKTLFLLFLSLACACFLVSCSNTNSSNLPMRTYVFEESKESLKPYVTLKENNQFEFVYSGISSYLPYGTYEIDDNRLILKTDDTKGDNAIKYEFQINDGTLIFNAKESTEFPSFTKLPDGAIFK